MSILNLGLQKVALTKEEMAPWAEEKVSAISSMQEVFDLHKKLEEEECMKRKSKARAEKKNDKSERSRNKGVHILFEFGNSSLKSVGSVGKETGLSNKKQQKNQQFGVNAAQAIACCLNPIDNLPER
eukprot:6473272-Ditylum_brightwellii.AAC.1